MGESCNLFLSRSDAEMIDASRANATWADALSPVAMRALQLANPRMAAELARILRSPDHPCNPRVVEQLLLNAIGNASIPDSYRGALPSALAKILDVTSDALGLVQAVSGWGPRATSIADTVTHSTRGAAFAYEILGTAALIEQNSKARQSHTRLWIQPEDRIDFGVKLQARYGAVFPGKRTTVEADLLIQRGFDHLIGVDFKHTLTGTYRSGISSGQLDGIRRALGTGEVHEFHFVCNGSFDGKAIGAVAELNETLRREGEPAAVYLHEFVRPIELT